MRYWYIALGILIVVQTFLWLYRDHREKHQKLKKLPDAGMIGEMVVLYGCEGMAEGTALPVPWEGMMGSAGFCDIVAPAKGMARVQLYFSFKKNRGLKIEPARGQECYVDGVHLKDRHQPSSDGWMVHGSILQVGECVFRLRLFAGLNVERKALRMEDEDLKQYGMPVASQGVPRPGYDGWADAQTEDEPYEGLHLVKDEKKDGNAETKEKGSGKRRQQRK